ncbi:hypothetical protein, partial [Halobium salinum]|uniref:hypothetical protein n=1 Tax=Halobium salinum TaxID=1364940 RepID=UPI00226E94E6
LVPPTAARILRALQLYRAAPAGRESERVTHLVALQESEDLLDPLVRTPHHLVDGGESVTTACDDPDRAAHLLDAEAEHERERLRFDFRQTLFGR